MQELRQSTSTTVLAGLFADSGDAAVESGLTITQSETLLSKNGAATAQKNESSSLTHRAGGVYAVSLDATDTDTLGRVDIIIVESGALAVWVSYAVVSQGYYDWKYGTAGVSVDADSIKDISMTTVTEGTLAGYVKSLPNNKTAGSASGGLPTIDANNYVAGIQGTTNTFDELLDYTVETAPSVKLKDCLAYILSCVGGESSGMNTATGTMKTFTGTSRVTASLDGSGNRTAVTAYTPPS